MGRPRKKRKYTRRKTDNGATTAVDDMYNSNRLVDDVKTLIGDAKPQVARLALIKLVPELQWVARLLDQEQPPAP